MKEQTTPCAHCGKPVIVKVGSYYLALGRYTCSAECQRIILNAEDVQAETQLTNDLDRHEAAQPKRDLIFGDD